MSTELQDLADHFKHVAQEGYVRMENGGYLARAVQSIERPSKTLPEQIDRIVDNKFLEHLVVKDLETIADIIRPKGLSDFKYAAEGSRTVCFESGGQAFRIGTMPPGTIVR